MGQAADADGIDLDELYEAPSDTVQRAITSHLTDYHLDYLRIATFFCLASGSEEGLDASPRGGDPGFVKALDRRTLAFADWPGNNRVESLRNLKVDSRIALLFLFPGLDIFLRINGRARIATDPPLLEKLTERERVPKAAVVVAVEQVLFHCGRAANRARLWRESSRLDRRSLPSPGTMLKALAELEEVDAKAFDELYDHAMQHDLY